MNTTIAQSLKASENLLFKGVWTGFMLNKDIEADDPVVQKLRDIARGKMKPEQKQKIIRDLKNKKVIKKIVEHTNLIPIVGRNVFARLLTGDGTYTGEINYLAFGDGDTAFTTASTILNNELYRKLVSDAAFDDNIAYIDVFIPSGDVADQTFKEAAAFIDATASADSGQAFSLVVQDFVKSGSMFVSLRITLSQAGE